ncbi:MAG: hypothetical protein NTZ78_10210 [Candidatus Aureabacteria bacterium]|nr:hypothetical protein [Candidatus Auribacterota bacterium]
MFLFQYSPDFVFANAAEKRIGHTNNSLVLEQDRKKYTVSRTGIVVIPKPLPKELG